MKTLEGWQTKYKKRNIIFARRKTNCYEKWVYEDKLTLDKDKEMAKKYILTCQKDKSENTQKLTNLSTNTHTKQIGLTTNWPNSGQIDWSKQKTTNTDSS